MLRDARKTWSSKAVCRVRNPSRSTEFVLQRNAINECIAGLWHKRYPSPQDVAGEGVPSPTFSEAGEGSMYMTSRDDRGVLFHLGYGLASSFPGTYSLHMHTTAWRLSNATYLALVL